MRRQQLSQRPENLLLKQDHSLAQGLMFAGLGGAVGSTRYNDSSPYGNHGTLTNMDPATDWVWSNEINRFATAHANLTEAILLTQAGSAWRRLPDTITFSVWWLSAGNYTTTQYLMGNHRSNGSAADFGVAFGLTNNKIEIIVSSITGIVLTSSASISSDAWRHVVAIRTGSAGSWQLQLYINGVLDNSGTTATDPAGGATSQIGIGNSGLYTTPLIGKISDPLIHNRALSPAEIQQLADPSNVMLSGLIQAPKRRLWNITRQIGTPYRPQRLIIGNSNQFLNLGV